MDSITIVATTWLPPGNEKKRLRAAEQAIRSWGQNLKYDGQIHLVVSDDGTEEPFWEELKEECIWLWRVYNPSAYVSFTQQVRQGVGASLNKGLRAAFELHGPIVLHAVDDWELLQPLDLNPWVNFLQDRNYDTGMVRFFAHPDLTGTFRFIPPHGWAVVLDRHHYVFSFRPCLWHKRFFDNLGYFEEGVSALDAEKIFNDKIVGQYPQFEGEHIWLALPEVWRPLDSIELSSIVP